MTEKLRFGIIGCGVIGQHHAQVLAGLPAAELVAVTDAVPEKAQELAEKYHITSYNETREMLAREHLDAVCICTPSGQHGVHAREAMLAGCHVVVEKPLEITRGRIDEMLAVRERTGRKLAVISQHRFDAASLQVKKLLEAGALGRLVLGSATIAWWRSQQYYDSGAWRGTWALDGGGVLMNQSIHSIDLLYWFMGPVKSLYAYTDTLVHRVETEDTAVAVLRFASGALGTITATTGAYPGVVTRLELCGERGSAVLENDRLSYLHLARDETEAAEAYGGGTNQVAMLESAEAATGHIDAHALQLTDFIRAVRAGDEPLLNGQGARHPVDIILGIYEAARTGREVTLS